MQPRHRVIRNAVEDGRLGRHCRFLAAKMESLGHPVYYFENMEGGHGSGTTPAQQARMQAVKYAYMIKQLATQNPIP